MKKGLCFLLVILFAFVSIVNCEELIYSNSEANYSYQQYVTSSTFPSPNTYASAFGMVFIMGEKSYNITCLTMYLRKVGIVNPTFCKVRVFDALGKVNTTDLKAESVHIDANSFNATHDLINFTFTGNNQIVLEEYHSYLFMLMAVNGTWDGSHCVGIGQDGTGIFYDGASCEQYTYAWHIYDGDGCKNRDCIFYLYGEYIVAEEDGGYTDEEMDASFMVGLVLMAIMGAIALLIWGKNK